MTADLAAIRARLAAARAEWGDRGDEKALLATAPDDIAWLLARVDVLETALRALVDALPARGLTHRRYGSGRNRAMTTSKSITEAQLRQLIREYRRRLDAIYSTVGYLGDLLNHGEYQEIGAALDGLSGLADVRGDERVLANALPDTRLDVERLAAARMEADGISDDWPEWDREWPIYLEKSKRIAAEYARLAKHTLRSDR